MSELAPERARIERIRDAQRRVVQPDETILFLLAALDASAAEVARLRERVSFGNHKRHQCEDNLSAAEARIKALEEAGDRMAERMRRLREHYRDHDDACLIEITADESLEAWRALRGTGEGDS